MKQGVTLFPQLLVAFCPVSFALSISSAAASFSPFLLFSQLLSTWLVGSRQFTYRNTGGLTAPYVFIAGVSHG
jgi:hypothetical protein